MYHTKIVNRDYTLNLSSEFYLLFQNCTTYNYKISYISSVYFSSLYNFVMFKDICKWDLLPLNQEDSKRQEFITWPLLFILSIKNTLLDDLPSVPWAGSQGVICHLDSVSTGSAFLWFHLSSVQVLSWTAWAPGPAFPCGVARAAPHCCGPGCLDSTVRKTSKMLRIENGSLVICSMND